MKIALCTVGSTGDIQPFLALAIKLQAAGHQVRVLSHPFHKDRFTKRGLDYVSCGPEVTQDDLNDMLHRMLQLINPIKQLELLMLEAFFEEKEKYFRECKAGTKGFDLAICHMVDFLGQEAVSQNGIPRISVILAPAGVPTRYNAPPLVGNLGFLNPLTWKVMTRMMRKVTNKAMDTVRGLGGTKQEIVRFQSLAPERNFIAASPTLARTFPDLPDHFRVTGPWTLPEPEFEPSAEILAFLEKHPRPVIVSFGSMGGNLGPHLTKTVLEALEITGKSAIIQSGYARLSSEKSPENVFFADYVPHGWLFAQGSCVVHHGGAGTTTAACRAGVPSVVVTFIADQPYFGSNLKRLGIAPKMIWFRKLNAKKLAKRIRIASEDVEMQAKAKTLQPTFLAEEGTEKAVEYIEQYAQEIGLM